MQKQVKRLPKTPPAQVGSDAAYPDQDAEDKEEVNAGAMEPSSDALEGPDDVAVAEDLEDVLPTSNSVGHKTRSDTSEADMGVNQSHEVSKSARDAARQLRGEAETANANSRKLGKLKRPSMDMKSALEAKQASTQRQLVPSTARRKSTYDIGGSPETPRLLARKVAGVAAFSPTRDQKKKALQAQHQTRATSKLSRAVQAQHDGDEDDGLASKVGQFLQLEHVQQDDRMYRDPFPDAVVQRFQQAERDAGSRAANADDAGHTGEDDQAQTQELAEMKKSADKPKRGRGRPTRSRKNGAWQTGSASVPVPKQLQEEFLRASEIATLKPGTERQSSVRSQWNLNQLGQDHAPRGNTEQWQLPQQQVDTEVEEQSQQPQAVVMTSTGGSFAAYVAPRRSGRNQRNITDANDRRNGTPKTSSAVSDAIAVSTNQPPILLQEDENGDGDGEPEKPVVLDLNEVQFNNVNISEAEDVQDEAIEAPVTWQNKKRKASKQAPQANTAAKRRKKDESNDEEYEEPPDSPPSGKRQEANLHRLWGQWLLLERIHSNLQYVACNKNKGEYLKKNEVGLQDDDVKAIVELCTRAKEHYQRLLSTRSEDAEPAGLLGEIASRVDGLRGRNDDLPPDFEDKTKITNIYSHLTPSLVQLVWQAVRCYDSIDRDQAPSGQISMGHLQIVSEIVSMTVDLEEAARRLYKVRPDTHLAVVQPVHHHIAVPLRTVDQTLKKILQRHHMNVQANARRQKKAEDRALALEQEERRSRQNTELTRIRQKWEQLHCERMAVEGGLMRPAKISHLRMPDPNRDVDGDGQAFDRVSVFHPRVGPPPGLLDRAKELIWTEGELRALMNALKEFQGPMVYEKTMRAWCPRGMILNKYNVTEIVAAAELMKESFERECELHGEEVEVWVKAIPVWSKSHAVGQENDDSFADLDEVVEAGAS